MINRFETPPMTESQFVEFERFWNRRIPITKVDGGNHVAVLFHLSQREVDDITVWMERYTENMEMAGGNDGN